MKLPQVKADLPLVLLMAAGLLFPAFAVAQKETPLGTVARQNRAQAKPKKVYTDEDIPTRASERGPSPSTASDADVKTLSPADKSGTADNMGKAEDKSRSEAAETSSSTSESQDSPAAAPIRQKLNNLKQLEGLLQKKIEKVQQAMAEDQDPEHRAGYLETLEANKQSLATTRQQITETEKELAEANR